MKRLAPLVIAAVFLSSCGGGSGVFVPSETTGKLAYRPAQGIAMQYNASVAKLNADEAMNGKQLTVEKAEAIGQSSKFPTRIYLVPISQAGRQVCSPQVPSYGELCPEARPMQGARVTLDKGDSFQVIAAIALPNPKGLSRPQDFNSKGPWSIDGAKLAYRLGDQSYSQKIKTKVQIEKPS